MYMEVGNTTYRGRIKTVTSWSNHTSTTWKVGWISLHKIYYPKSVLGWSHDGEIISEEHTAWELVIKQDPIKRMKKRK